MSYPYQPHPPAGPPLPTEFRMAPGGFGRMLAPFIIVILFGGLVGMLFGGITFSSTAGAIAVGVGFPLLLVGILYRKFRRLKSGTVVRFSPYGVELMDAMGFHLRVRWPDILQIGPVITQMANPKSVGVEGGTSVSVGAMKSLGIIGWGERKTPKRMPAWMRAGLEAEPRNPHDGRPLVSIALGGVDPNWPQGPMGAWVRMYRPDLMR